MPRLKKSSKLPASRFTKKHCKGKKLSADIKILKSDANDLPEILELQRLSFAENAIRYNDQNIPPLRQTLDELIEEAKSHIILKAVDGAKIVGSVRGCRKPDHCYIGRLIVHPDYQNQGIGRRLMAAMENELGGSAFELTAGHLDDKNISLYGKLGYKAYGTEKISDNLSLIKMRKVQSN